MKNSISDASIVLCDRQRNIYQAALAQTFRFDRKLMVKSAIGIGSADQLSEILKTNVSKALNYTFHLCL